MKNKKINIINELIQIDKLDKQIKRLNSKKLNSEEEQQAKNIIKNFYKNFNMQDFTNQIKQILA